MVRGPYGPLFGGGCQDMSKYPRPKKRYGQNFLHDKRIIYRIVNAANVSPQDSVLEIGPGRGHLTEALASKGANVVAIEADKDLTDGPLRRFDNMERVRIIQADAAEFPIEEIYAIPRSYKLVANLPFNVGSHILRNLICSENRPSVAVVMLQKEVAKNVAATSGRMGLLSVIIQTYSKAKVVFSVPASAFTPTPKVSASVLLLETYREPLIKTHEYLEFFKFAAAGFASPRKQIHNSFATGLSVSLATSKNLLTNCGIDYSRRPGTLSVPEWIELFNHYRE